MKKETSYTKKMSLELNRIIRVKGKQAGADYIAQLVTDNNFSNATDQKLAKKYDSLSESHKMEIESDPESTYDEYSEKMKDNIKILRDAGNTKGVLTYIKVLLSTFKFPPARVKALKKVQDVLGSEVATLGDAERLRLRSSSQKSNSAVLSAKEIHAQQTAQYKTGPAATSFIDGLRSDFDSLSKMRSNDPDLLKQTYHFYAEKWFRLPQFGGHETMKFNEWAKKTFDLSAETVKDNTGADTVVRSSDEVFEAFRQMVQYRRRRGGALLGKKSVSKHKADAETTIDENGDIIDANPSPKKSPFSLILQKIKEGKYTVTTAEAYEAVIYLKSSIKDADLIEDLKSDLTVWAGKIEELQAKVEAATV